MKGAEKELVELAASCTLDPLRFVMGFFPWGEAGTELAGYDGPREWQKELLGQIRDGLVTPHEAIQLATASGHGCGKSALVAWIILWAMSTCPDTKGVVTANTEVQLRTKTWPEVAKWHRLLLCRHWFKLTATAMFSIEPGHEKTWRIDAVPWSENNTEAFAGLHNKGRRILLLFDEASAIPDLIWEVAEGALTDEDTEIIWACFGNPTRAVGRFRECWGRFRHRWKSRQIDSRTVPGTNKAQLDKWVEDYGEDSDFVRVRVRGQFPSVDACALISPEEVDAAFNRHIPQEAYEHAAKIIGVDVARQGTDSSVFAPRQGLVAWPFRVLRIPDTMLLAGELGKSMDKWKPDAVFVDGTGGWGAGVADASRSLGRPITEVYFSGKSSDARYFNKRSEMWFEMILWIKNGGAMPYDAELKEELTSATYTFQGDKFRLCEKDDIKDLIGRSPDKADALALTFAFPVQPKLPFAANVAGGQTRSLDYHPLDRM